MRAYDNARGTSVERGYDVLYRRLRVPCFQRDGWRCVDCGWEPEIVWVFRGMGLGDPPTAAVLKALSEAFARGDRHLHADHEISIAERPDLRLVLDNLKTRCDTCHRAKTMREMMARDR